MTSTKQRLWTVDEYHQMVQSGILSPDEQVELFVLRNPGQGIYQQEITLHDQETMSPLAFPDASVSVVELLP